MAEGERADPRVYMATMRESFHKDFGLASQIQRASVSVMANIAEGFERRRRSEFHRFVEIAKASCAEVGSHLYVALDVGYLSLADFEDLQGRVAEVSRIWGGLKASLEPHPDSDPPGTTRASGLGPRA
ncbi:MAG: four helix bundle protein [Tepidiformaceae bacterium]